MRHPFPLFCLVSVFALWTTSCAPPAQVVTSPPPQTSCEASIECAEGEVCVGGTCRPGECVDTVQSQCGPDAPPDVAPFCCKAWQVCNGLNECVADPNSVIGNQCEVSDDCAGVGQFCSGGTCYSPANRDPCTASHQCPASERCDRTVFLCVPDNGGCTFADQLPELSCEAGQVCDTETGFCLDLGEEQECTTDGDCRPGQQCDSAGRCVQCLSDADCGPGTQCNEGTGSCIPIAQTCDEQGNCPGNKVCDDVSNTCITPQCLSDADCEGLQQCDVASYTCFLPPASCNESDEPNDTVGQATPIQVSGYSSTLCRSNTDVLAFPVEGDKRYRITVRLPNYDGSGVQVSVLDGNGSVVDSDTFGFELSVTVSAITPLDATGNYYLRLNGAGSEADQWTYSVQFEVTVAPEQVDCATEMSAGIEPNDSFATAYAVTPGQPVTFARCGTGDVDYYKIEVDPLHGIEVSVEHDREEGDLEIYLYDGPSSADQVDSSTSTSAVERVEAAEGPTEFWLAVELWQYDSDADTNQSYTVSAVAVPRPAACDADIHEPDGTRETAGELAPDTALSAIRCIATDVDYYALTVPANRGGQVRIDFTNSEGNLKLDLLDADGLTLATSNRTPASDAEYLDIPFSGQEEHYFVRVGISSGTGSVGQVYGIQATTYDASTCTLSEAVSNNTLAAGQCVGAFESDIACAGAVLASPVTGPGLQTCDGAATAIPGCGTICGVGDQDWFRVGKLNNGQVLRARLEHDPMVGRLGLALARMNADPAAAPSFVARDFNSNGNAVLELTYISQSLDPAFVREYGVLVSAEGDGAYSAQPYSLEIEVGAPCLDDAFEPNNSRAASAALRLNPTPGVAFDTGDLANTLCVGDLDVFEFLAFAGETVRATLEGPDGTTVYIGKRSADSAAVEPEPLPCGEAVPEGQPAPSCDTDAGPSDAGSADGGALDAGVVGTGRFVASVVNDATQSLFVTVKRTDSNALGPYTLRIEVSP